MKNAKKVRVEDAVGMVLVHDMTRIIPGKFKGVGFKKGHVVGEQDIPALLKLGKRHLYVLNLSEDQIHEDEASLRIAKAVCSDNLSFSDPKEGKSSIRAETDGIVKIDSSGLLKINRIDDVIIATLKNNYPCQAGQVVAATRIIPLVIVRKKIEKLEAIAARKPILAVRPFRQLKVGAVVTGSELYKGLIKDEFDAYVGAKVEKLGSEVVHKIVVPDEPGQIAEAIKILVEKGVDLILTTGGLSVDPDDVTRIGVKRAGAKVKFYGTPILPGAMFLYAVLGQIPILGLPACVYYHNTTIFDLMFPRVLAGEDIRKSDVAAMGHGGLCLDCEICRYPVCPFGK